MHISNARACKKFASLLLMTNELVSVNQKAFATITRLL